MPTEMPKVDIDLEEQVSGIQHEVMAPDLMPATEALGSMSSGPVEHPKPMPSAAPVTEASPEDRRPESVRVIIEEQLSENIGGEDAAAASTTSIVPVSPVKTNYPNAELFEDPLVGDEQLSCMLEIHHLLREYTKVCTIVRCNWYSFLLSFGFSESCFLFL
jgi:hypothetical protein